MNLLTVNLEKKMVSGNSLSKKEQVLLKEHKNFRESKMDTKVLERLGMTNTIVEGNKIVTNINNLAKYEKNRVFHIDQIEKICKRYDLRFLPCKYYKGQIDPLLTERVQGFEEQYNYNSRGNYTSYSGDSSNYYIVAPKNSFALEERPKDPLFFAKIGNNHWYLVHKWGNDLSITRRIKTFLCIDEDSWISFLVFIGIAAFVIFLGTTSSEHNYWKTDRVFAWNTVKWTSIICFVCAVITNIIQYRSGLDKWNSKFRD